MCGFKRHSATTTTAAALAALVAVLVQRCGALHGRAVAETPRRDSAARFAAAAAKAGRENAGLEEFEPEKTLPTAAKQWPPINVDGPRRESRASDVSLVIKKIYENMSESNRRPGGSGDRLDGFDIVRALEDNSGGGGERLHYHFDTSSVEASQETLTKAEFYVFIRAPRSGQAAVSSAVPSVIKLSLYRVLDERRLRIDNATADKPSSEAVSLLATRRVLASHRDEVDFTGSIALRDTVKEWIARPRTNKGLLLTVTDGGDRRRAGGQLDNGAELIVAGGSSGDGRGMRSAGRQPVLIIYTKTKSQSVDTIGTPPQQRVIREVDRLAGGHSQEASLCKGLARAASVQSNGCTERDDGSGWDDGSEQPGRRLSPLPIFGRRARTIPRRNLATAAESSSAFGASSAAARSPSSSDELATSDGSTASFGSGGGEDESPQHLPQLPAAGRRRSPPTPSRQLRPPEGTAEADGLAADITSSPPVRNSGFCRPQSFTISFEELNYPVIAPKTLEVGLCAGRCKLAPSDLNRLNLTNHAKLLAMARFLNPSRAKLAKACCVPGELTKASLLYSDEDGIVTMRNYDNMVVKSCTCR